MTTMPDYDEDGPDEDQADRDAEANEDSEKKS